MFQKIRYFFSSATSTFLIKKFYKQINVETEPNPLYPNQKYCIKLDKKNIKSANTHIIRVPSFHLATLIAHEFNQQDEYIRAHTMPLFHLAKAAIDSEYDPSLREYFIHSLIAFFENDTICYQEKIESKLGALQNKLLTPIRTHIENDLKIKIPIHYDLETSEMTPENKKKLFDYFQSFSNWGLVSLESLAGTMKSTSLALSLIKNKISVQEAFNCSRIEEDYQAKLFGKVEGEHDLRETLSLLTISSSKVFFDLSHIKSENKI